LEIPATVNYNENTYEVTAIGEYAFFECIGLTSVVIPNSVTYIGDWAFCSCYSLNSIDIPNSVTSIEKFAFAVCSSLISIDIHNSVASLGEFAFGRCTALTTVNFNAINCTTMGSEINPVFQGCYALTTVNIGENVQTIPNFAFMYCTALTSIDIPNTVTSIGFDAFGYCTGLQGVTVNWNTPLAIDEDAFDNVDISNVTLVVPYGTIALYAETDVWKDFNILSQPSGVAELKQMPFAVYPNPVINGQLTIENGELNANVQIIDLSGKIVLSTQHTTIDVSALSSGAYIVKSGNRMGKVIIKN
jgi:hypothetical protein